MEIYINSISAISPQDTFSYNDIPSVLDNNLVEYLQIKPVDYTEYISGKALRRMSKYMKIGLISGLKAIERSHLNSVDSIVIGSGSGNMEDTSKFLTNIIENNERMLVPTSFAQSTNNVISGQLALRLNNKGYNSSYVHDNIAFESALLDTIMQFEISNINSALIGGVDIIYPKDFDIKRKGKIWKKNGQEQLDIYKTPKNGCLPGESSCFFIVENKNNNDTFAKIKDVEIIFMADNNKLSENLYAFLNKNSLVFNDIDLVFGGYNGDPQYDNQIDEFILNTMPNVNTANYKHFCGEHNTASAFALWLASITIKQQQIHNSLIRNIRTLNKPINNVLIYQKNFFNGNNHGFILLQKA